MFAFTGVRGDLAVVYLNPGAAGSHQLSPHTHGDAWSSSPEMWGETECVSITVQYFLSNLRETQRVALTDTNERLQQIQTRLSAGMSGAGRVAS